MKKLLLRSAFAAVLGLAPMGLPLMTSVAVAQDTTRTSVDWAGTYSGTVPCASCPGIKTKLVLTDKNTFTLTETYIGKSKPMVTRGKLKWNADDSTAKLVARDEDREIFISEGYVEFVGDDRTSDNPKYRLTKAGQKSSTAAPAVATNTNEILFRNGSETLSTTRSTVGRNGAKVQFNGMWNFGKQMPAGHRSLESIIVINCADESYGLTNVLYFDGANGKGKIIEQAAQPDPDMNPIPGGSDVMAQAKRAFCK